MIRVYATLAALALVLALVVGAYGKGRADNEARHTAAALKSERAAAQAMADLAATEEANRMLARALEDQAYAEPPASTCGLPRSRVLRLKDR
jgi:hypothetical protein